MGLCETKRNTGNSVLIKDNLQRDTDPKNFYDVIVSIKSIMDISKGGWNIKLSDNFQKNYKNLINNKALKIGIIGNSNKGKSFILSKLSKIQLPEGTSIKTEGLSVKYPDLVLYKERRITLLDSAGLETPVLEENNEKEKKIQINCQGKSVYRFSLTDKQQKDEKGNNNFGKQEKEERENEIFKEKSREKIITESFLQNYIIYNSDILLVVVGILTYSEQKILNKIKSNVKKKLPNKPIICIIHNLITYITVNQVKSYIEETLLKSVTFKIEEHLKINTSIESQTGIAYHERDKDSNIYHLIFANDYSKAGKYYNDYTLQFIEKLYEINTSLEGFNIIETVKERFKDFSKDVLENFQGEMEFDNSPNSIKLKNPKGLKLKKFFIDESGFSYMKEDGFETNYSCYKANNQIIVKIEAPGNCKIDSDIISKGEYVIIKIKGIKEEDEQQKNIENTFYNERKFGKFYLSIPLNQDGFTIKNAPPKIEKKDGIIILTYQLEKIQGRATFSPKKN